MALARIDRPFGAAPIFAPFFHPHPPPNEDFEISLGYVLFNIRSRCLFCRVCNPMHRGSGLDYGFHSGVLSRRSSLVL